METETKVQEFYQLLVDWVLSTYTAVQVAPNYKVKKSDGGDNPFQRKSSSIIKI